ncbi:TPA: helix-turn-helix transcriptional regulator [Klebsiella pneumoniae]|nr:YafY family transcriptional regulator [Klebsiella pneumoniae]
MTRRADRLFQIVQILRGRRLTTAALLAERLGVSERTVYRDIRDLSLSGVPVEGEAGSGYRLLAGYDLPPLMLTTKESEALIAAIRLLKTWGGEALIAAIRLLKTWGGEALSQSLESAQEKMLAILPEARRRQAEQTRLFAPDLGAHRYAKTHFDVIHQAVSNQQVLQLHYQDESGQVTWREVLPLGLFFWGERWLLVAWCELRNDYRNFRLDRCLEVRRTERRFSECADRSLSDFLRKIRCEVREK